MTMKIVYRRITLHDELKRAMITDYNRGAAVATILENYQIARSTLYKILREATNATDSRKKHVAMRKGVKDEEH